MKHDGGAVVTVEVLAGAYRGKGLDRTLLSHSLAEGAAKSLCGKIPADNLCDRVLPTPPTCPVCAARLARLAARIGGAS
jgi:hypothetical protein